MELLLACCKAFLHKEDGTHIRLLSHDHIDWNAFITLVDWHRLSPIVYRTLNRVASDGVPEHVLDNLRVRFEKNTRRSLELTSELVRLLKLLWREKIFVLPLKGPVLALQVYGNLSFRHAGDLDLLIPPQYVRRADQLLRENGYRRVSPSFELTSRQHVRFLHIRSDFHYIRNQSGLKVDLQWRWSYNPYLFSLDVDYVRNRLQTTQIAGTSVKTLSHKDSVLYLCSHGAKHAWFRLFWLCDLAEILSMNYAVDWAEVMANAAKLDVQNAVAEGFLLSKLLFGIALPEPVEAYLEKNRVVTGLIKLALRIIKQPSDPSDHSLTSRNFLLLLHRFMLPSDLGHKLGECLIVSTQPNDWRTVPLPAALSSLYYLLRPLIWFWGCYVKGLPSWPHVASSGRTKNSGTDMTA